MSAASDGELWNLPFTVVPGVLSIGDYVCSALEGEAAGNAIPFVTVLRDSGKIIGSTRFLNIDRANRKIEIGHTWLARSWQRSFANTEAKYLMLRTAFEDMACIRVQFVTDERNTASRAAILRLGAREEGIIRHERLMPDGRKRNSAFYSILDEEWPGVKRQLESWLDANGD